MNLEQFEVVVRRFDPTRGPEADPVEEFVLPVDSPDAEHAVSAAMSNAVAFTPKVDGERLRPVAFWATEVRQRS